MPSHPRVEAPVQYLSHSCDVYLRRAIQNVPSINMHEAKTNIRFCLWPHPLSGWLQARLLITEATIAKKEASYKNHSRCRNIHVLMFWNWTVVIKGDTKVVTNPSLVKLSSFVANHSSLLFYIPLWSYTLLPRLRGSNIMLFLVRRKHTYTAH